MFFCVPQTRFSSKKVFFWIIFKVPVNAIANLLRIPLISWYRRCSRYISLTVLLSGYVSKSISKRQPFRSDDYFFGWFSYPICPAYWSYHSIVIKMVLWGPWPLVDKVSQRLSAGSAWPNNESSVKLVTVQVYTIYYLLWNHFYS